MRLLFTSIVSAAALAAIPAFADEIEDSIREGLSAYGSGDFTAAKQALDYASQLIAQRNAEGLGGLLPAALPGWTAEDVEQNAAGMAMFGGGIQAERKYSNGNDTIKLQIVGDSPLLATWMPMLANPAMAAAVGKVAKIGNQRVLQTKDGQVIMVVANRFLVTVDGSGSIDDKMAYASAIDFDKLAAL